MIEDTLRDKRALIIRVEQRACALPLAHVIEIMRPLPVETIPGAPAFVCGVSVIRGIPTPVINLRVLLGNPEHSCTTARFITLCVDKRQVAVLVDAVCEIRELDALTIQTLPPLFQAVSHELIETIATLDAQLLIVLRTAWELPDGIGRPLAEPERPGNLFEDEAQEQASCPGH